MLTGYVWMGIDVFVGLFVVFIILSSFSHWLYSSFDFAVCARIAITYLVVEISGLIYNGAK